MCRKPYIHTAADDDPSTRRCPATLQQASEKIRKWQFLDRWTGREVPQEWPAGSHDTPNTDGFLLLWTHEIIGVEEQSKFQRKGDPSHPGGCRTE